MKISLLGPTFPFRGGIAHHTTLLARQLQQDHNLQFISFTRQYPRWLYPGKSDRDNSKQALHNEEALYLLDSMNPLSWSRTAKAIIDFDPKLLIIPWWVAFWAPSFLHIIKTIRKRTEARIVILCHNSVEHESAWWKKKATRAVLSGVDQIFTHSKSETENLRVWLGSSIKITTVFLPTYSDLGGEIVSKEQAKQELNIEGSVLLFFGFVREYKGLHVLLDALPIVLEEQPCTLLVVGEFWKDKQTYLQQIQQRGIEEHTRLVDGYLPNEDLASYFCAADLVVQPYLSATGSAVAQLAYGFDRPVIATRVGSLAEVIEDKINGRLVAPDDSQALADAIIDSLQTETLQEFNKQATRTKHKYSWEELTKRIVTKD